MAAVSPVIELVNGVEVVPSLVMLDVVGVPVVFQQTPFALIAALPSLEMTPPLVAKVVDILVIESVVSVGATGTEAGFTWAMTKSFVVKLPKEVDVPNVFERMLPVLSAVPLPPRFTQLPAPSSFAILI